MRFVPIKNEQQQALLMLRAAPRGPPRSALGARRGVRDQLIGQRTATINALRGHLADLGIVAAQRQAGLRELLAVFGEPEEDRMPPLARKILQTLAAHLHHLEGQIAALDRRLVALTRSDPVCRSLVTVPGVGPVIATAVAATVPDATTFRSGRHRGSMACGTAGRSTSWLRASPTSWRGSSGRCSVTATPSAGAPIDLPRAARAQDIATASYGGRPPLVRRGSRSAQSGAKATTAPQSLERIAAADSPAAFVQIEAIPPGSHAPTTRYGSELRPAGEIG